MRNKTFYKYKNLACKIYDMELRESIGGSGLGGNLLPAPTPDFTRKLKKLRKFYDKNVQNNPQYFARLWRLNTKYS